MRVGHEDSFIPDRELESGQWATVARPAVLTGIRWDMKEKLYSLTAVCLGVDGNGARPEGSAPVSSSSASPSEGEAMAFVPEWTLPGSFCYAFKRPLEFFILPSQTPVPAAYVAADADLLARTFAPPEHITRVQDREEHASPERDVRYDARLRETPAQFVARLLPLPADPRELSAILLQAGSRAWFDECVRIATRVETDFGIGLRWTGAQQSPDGHELDDSYRGQDQSLWRDLQQECSWAATREGDAGEDIWSSALPLPWLTVVEPDDA
ncbi:hypothetical protein AURDEDRAFT_121340 [Auricularia subglabra TFB-10046 SS5]|nr:hypothetical protein AURDEDRAFT_121340 [Auricularia subglabra TFB-10046 SS5]